MPGPNRVAHPVLIIDIRSVPQPADTVNYSLVISLILLSLFYHGPFQYASSHPYKLTCGKNHVFSTFYVVSNAHVRIIAQ